MDGSSNLAESVDGVVVLAGAGDGVGGTSAVIAEVVDVGAAGGAGVAGDCEVATDGVAGACLLVEAAGAGFGLDNQHSSQQNTQFNNPPC